MGAPLGERAQMEKHPQGEIPPQKVEGRIPWRLPPKVFKKKERRLKSPKKSVERALTTPKEGSPTAKLGGFSAKNWPKENVEPLYCRIKYRLETPLITLPNFRKEIFNPKGPK